MAHHSGLGDRHCGNLSTSENTNIMNNEITWFQTGYLTCTISDTVTPYCCFLSCFICSVTVYLFRTEGKQELLVLAGSQKARLGADMESFICGRVGLDLEWHRGFSWKQRMQVGLQDLPVERQLQMASSQRERQRVLNH